MYAAITAEPGVSLDILPLYLSSSAALSLVETSFVGTDRPTGIYAFSDEYAVVLLGALTRLGIRVPQEVALVGTDNLPIGEFVWPSLTSMCFDALDMGSAPSMCSTPCIKDYRCRKSSPAPLFHNS